MKKVILTIILLSISISCKEKINNKIRPLHWLIGTWHNNDKNAPSTETWTQSSTTTMHGVSYIVAAKDTVFYESIVLKQIKDELFYTVTSKGQKDNRPVSFKLTSFEDDCAIFENPEHDFPQKIIYKLINKDSIVATILGDKDGKTATEVFPMQKNKN